MDQILYQIKKTNNFPFKLNSQELLFLQKIQKINGWITYLNINLELFHRKNSFRLSVICFDRTSINL